MLLAEAPWVYVLIHMHLIHKFEVPINLEQTQMIVQVMQKLYFSGRVRGVRQRQCLFPTFPSSDSLCTLAAKGKNATMTKHLSLPFLRGDPMACSWNSGF